jgi:hypothetical protein
MEKRIYGINLDLIKDLTQRQTILDFAISDNDFIEIAEKQGIIWSLKGFIHEYNISDINQRILIRVI